MNKLLFVIILVIVFSCKSNKINVEYAKTKLSELSLDRTKEVKSYMKYIPLEYLPESLEANKEKVIIFQGESFKGHYAIVNNKDTIDFRKFKDSSCIGSRFYKFKKSKKIYINTSDGRKDLYLKVKGKYNYIEISGDKSWYITYSDYPLIHTCI